MRHFSRKFWYRENTKSIIFVTTLVPKQLIYLATVLPGDQCCVAGSKSESEKKFGFGFGSRHCSKIKMWKIADQTLEREEKKRMFFSWKTFSSVVQIPEHIWTQWEAPLKKNSGQNITIKDTNPKPKKNCGSESKSEKNEFGSTTLQESLIIRDVFIYYTVK
jgi:hypothetical protein